MIGSPRALRHSISVPRKRSWTNFRTDARPMRSGQAEEPRRPGLLRPRQVPRHSQQKSGVLEIPGLTVAVNVRLGRRRSAEPDDCHEGEMKKWISTAAR